MLGISSQTIGINIGVNVWDEGYPILSNSIFSLSNTPPSPPGTFSGGVFAQCATFRHICGDKTVYYPRTFHACVEFTELGMCYMLCREGFEVVGVDSGLLGGLL